MSNVQKVSVALTPEFMALLEEAVESGEYTSASEVIRDALRHWKEHRAHQDLSREELRSLWQHGVESGPGRFGSIDAIGRKRGTAPPKLSDEQAHAAP
jgi:antitoxin ParD1/3/4